MYDGFVVLFWVWGPPFWNGGPPFWNGGPTYRGWTTALHSWFHWCTTVAAFVPWYFFCTHSFWFLTESDSSPFQLLPPCLILQDLLNVEPDSSFEEYFYKFRVTVKELEGRLVHPLKQTFDRATTLPALLRVLEMYQGISRRDAIKVTEILAIISYHILHARVVWEMWRCYRRTVYP